MSLSPETEDALISDYRRSYVEGNLTLQEFEARLELIFSGINPLFPYDENDIVRADHPFKEGQ